MDKIIKKKWMNFVFSHKSDSEKTEIWDVLKKDVDTHLGVIYWEGSFRQYVFRPADMTYFSASCLKEIEEVIMELYNKWKMNHSKN